MSSRYLQSVLRIYLSTSCRAQDILEHFLIGKGDLELKHVTQVTMESPNVNWVFHKQLQSKITLDFGCQMLDIGSCELHVVNGAFKHDSDASKWDVPSVLRSVHSLFHETPARREDYTRVTDREQFGLNYCATRWLENMG